MPLSVVKTHATHVANASAPGHPAGARLRVVVAMSGGVDSSVVAGLMRQAGHDVIGVTLQLYDHGSATGRKGSCCAGQDIHDARRVADRLGISALRARLREPLQLSRDAASPRATPPARRRSRASPATSRSSSASCSTPPRSSAPTCWRRAITFERRDGPHGPELSRAVDAERDQSYFLFATTPDAARYLWFPLGGYPRRGCARWRASLGAAGRGQVRQPGHLLRAARALHERHRAPEAGRGEARRHRARRRPSRSAGTTASSTTRSASARAWASPAPSRCTSSASMRHERGRGGTARQLAHPRARP